MFHVSFLLEEEWMHKLPIQYIYMTIFRGKVRQICISSDSFLLYVTSHIYYSHVYVTAEWKPLICIWETHRNPRPPASHCGHYHILSLKQSLAEVLGAVVHSCVKKSAWCSVLIKKTTNQLNKPPNKILIIAKKGENSKILWCHIIKNSMLIVCRSLLFPAQKYAMPLEMIQRQVTRMVKIMPQLPCKEQTS